MADRARAGSEAAVLKADDERIAALRAADIPALERLVHDGLVYVHSASGTSNPGKDAYLDNLRSGKQRYTLAEAQDRIVHVEGDAAWMTGRMTFKSRWSDGRESGSDNRFLAVWVREGGAWRMIGWQSTGIRQG